MTETTEAAATEETLTAPAFQVTRGELSAEELAALTVVLAAAGQSSDSGSTTKRQPRGWTNRQRMMPAWAGRSGWGNF